MAWTPNDENALQWFLDENEGNGEPYDDALVDGLPVLRPLETVGAMRAPRQGRRYEFTGTEYLAIASLTGSEIATCDGTAVPTVSAGRIDFTPGSCWNLRVTNGSVYHCNEENGTDCFDASGNARHGIIVNASLGSFHAIDPDVPNPANEVGHTNNAGVIVPRNEGTPDEDAQGNGLQFANAAPHPAVVDSPVITFNGVDEFVDFGQIDLAGDYEVTVVAKHPPQITNWLGHNSFGNHSAYWNAGTSLVWKVQYTNHIFTWPDERYDEWLTYVITKTGSDVSVTRDGVPATENPLSAPEAVFYQVYGKERANHGASQIAELKIVDAGTTVFHHTMQEGAGNIIHDIGSPGYTGTITGNLTNMWANRANVRRDHCIQYGGNMKDGAFVPGMPGSGDDADGNPKVLLPKRHGNANSRIDYDYWNAPELTDLLLPASTAPGELLRNVAPNDAKYRSEIDALVGSDGTAYLEGDDRFFNCYPALTGAARDSAIGYIGDLSPPTQTTPAIVALTCEGDVWDGAETLEYQWYRADDNTGTNEVAIVGATSETYLVQAEDDGKWLRRRTTATNAGGSAEAYSNYFPIGGSGGGGGGYPAAADVRTGISYGDADQFTGVLTVPAVGDVRLGVGFDANMSLVGNVRLPAASDVRLAVAFDALDSQIGLIAVPVPGRVISGYAVDQTVGTFAYPLENQVLNNVDYGADGNEFTGTVIVETYGFPGEKDVRLGVVYGDQQQFTGGVRVPPPEKVELGYEYDYNDTETGTLDPGSTTGYPLENDVRENVIYGNASQYTGNYVPAPEERVATGELYGSMGVEFVGSYVADAGSPGDVEWIG